MTTSIALVEFGTGHIECLYAQAEILEASGYRVLIVCTEANRERIRSWENHDQIVDEVLTVGADKSTPGRLREVTALRRQLRELGVTKVVINTLAGNTAMFFALLPRRFETFGIVHSVTKFRKRWMKHASRTMGGFFVLNDYLLTHCPNDMRIRSFYPIRFPAYRPRPDGPQKPAGEFWVCVPGSLEYKRRDYLRLLEELRAPLDARIRFILLGNGWHRAGDGADFASRVGGSRRIVMFDHFVEDDLFDHYLRRADLIMPLNGNYERYNSVAISGAFNLSFGYRIPMLVESDWLRIDDFRVSSFGYEPGSLAKRLSELTDTPEALEEKACAMERYEKFSFEVQRTSYLDLIEGARES